MTTEPSARPLTLEDIAALTPRTIDEALRCMELGLDYFHERDDFRAVFLRAYHIITRNVLTAIRHGNGKPFFLDGEWMSRLAGKFATLYFRSLLTFEKPPHEEMAWKVAHGMALEKTSSVLQDVLLGINAHIKYDLAVAIERNLREHGDERDPRVLASRKRDHDQANRILRRSIDEIKRVIPRHYGGSMRVLDFGALKLDEYLAIAVVRHHREIVWFDALDLLRCSGDGQYDAIMQRMNIASHHMAEVMLHRHWLLPRLVERSLARTRKSDFSDLR